jgi:hypothetical protein
MGPDMGVGNKKGRTATLQNDPQQIVSDFNADLFYLDVDDYDPATDALYDIEDMDYLRGCLKRGEEV